MSSPSHSSSPPHARNPSLLAEPFFRSDEIVLQGLPLRPGEWELSTFGEDVWNLTPAIQIPSLGSVNQIDFRALSPRTRIVLKEYLFARVHRSAHGYSRIKARTVLAEFHQVRSFFNDFQTWLNIQSLSEITQPLLEQWLGRARLEGYSAHKIYHTLHRLRALHAYRRFLTQDALTFLPWGNASLRHISGYGGEAENTTKRIPEPVMGPFLQWALRYITDFSDEILTAVNQEYRTATRRKSRKGESLSRLQSYLDHLRQTEAGLPNHGSAGRKGTGEVPRGKDLNWSAVSRAAGISQAQVSQADRHDHRKLVMDALSELGFDWERQAAGSPEALVALRRSSLTGRTLTEELEHLMSACYIVIAYLSGMRPSEVLSLHRGCVELTRSGDGVIERYRLHGRVFKHRDEGGDPTSWIVIKPVTQAVQVLEEIQTLKGWTADRPLFTTLKDEVPWTQNAYGRLNSFRDHVNSLSQRSQKTPSIPLHNEEPWHFVPSQFRRTVAWYIANRPMGIVAGALQYKHTETAIFEGYGGLSASGFRLEVEQEEALAKQSLLYETYDNWKEGILPVGHGAARVEEVFRHIQEEAQDFPGMIANERRLQDLLKAQSAILHAGILNDCFFDKARAACHERAGTPGQEGPLFQVCAPDRCPNAIITQRHLPKWQAAEERINSMIGLCEKQKKPGLSLAQLTYLKNEKKRIHHILETSEHASSQEV